MKINKKCISKQENEVLIVLGAKIQEDGKPSNALVRRVNHAVDIVRKGCESGLILTGGIGNFPPAEAVVMKTLALSKGIPENKIFLEITARSTFENAFACLRIMEINNWDRALIITDRYHMSRALLVFQILGIKVSGSHPEYTFTNNNLRRWIYCYLREIAAFAWYYLRFSVLKIY
jgi:uncharacterized SAM-binding protein YcdF (DUF218 family)